MVRGAPISTTTEIRYKTRMMKNMLNIQTSFRTHKEAPIFQGLRGEFAIGVPLGAPRRLYGDMTKKENIRCVKMLSVMKICEFSLKSLAIS